MAYGPAVMLAVKFPGNEFAVEIVPALKVLIETVMIRVNDLLFILKDNDATVTFCQQC